MTIWSRARSVLQSWRSPAAETKANPERQLLEANRNLRELIEDTSIPAAVRAELAAEFEEIDSISEKLRAGEVHLAAFALPPFVRRAIET